VLLSTGRNCPHPWGCFLAGGLCTHWVLLCGSPHRKVFKSHPSPPPFLSPSTLVSKDSTDLAGWASLWPLLTHCMDGGLPASDSLHTVRVIGALVTRLSEAMWKHRGYKEPPIASTRTFSPCAGLGASACMISCWLLYFLSQDRVSGTA
jgi:hypothetical protein